MGAAVPVTAALAAAQAGSVGIGFSGGGFLIPFFLGVIHVLYKDLGILSSNTPVAGGSAGSIVAMTANGVINYESMLDEVHRLSAFCRGHGNCYGTLQSEVMASAERLLPPDAAERTNKQGRTYLQITYPGTLGLEPAQSRSVNKFKSRPDLISAVASSIYIPWWAGPRVVTEFRGDMVYDGSFNGPGPGFLPCPPNITYCVRVSSMPAGFSLGSFLVDILTAGPAALPVLGPVLRTTIHGPNLPTHLANAAIAYLTGEKLSVASEPGQLAKLVHALLQLVTPGEGEADIWPGRRHKLPFSELEWATGMIRPLEPAGIKAVFELGKAEALSWAQEAGFLKTTRNKNGA